MMLLSAIKKGQTLASVLVEALAFMEASLEVCSMLFVDAAVKDISAVREAQGNVDRAGLQVSCNCPCRGEVDLLMLIRVISRGVHCLLNAFQAFQAFPLGVELDEVIMGAASPYRGLGRGVMMTTTTMMMMKRRPS